MPLKILVVDDQELVRRTLRSILAQQPHWKIFEAPNGRVAVDSLPAIQPDVVVMDLVMPEMNGIEAAYEIHLHAPKTKVILMSSYYAPEEAALLARLLDGNFIEKSQTGKELVATIKRLLPT
jgi:DNA-binding NarL/FixJ family response regulator